jgi:hypothetical protein
VKFVTPLSEISLSKSFEEKSHIGYSLFSQYLCV